MNQELILEPQIYWFQLGSRVAHLQYVLSDTATSVFLIEEFLDQSTGISL